MHERETTGNVASQRGNAQAAWDEQARQVARHLEAAAAHGKPLPDQCSLADLRDRTRKMRAEAALARARAQARSRRIARANTLPTATRSASGSPHCASDIACSRGAACAGRHGRLSRWGWSK